MKKESSIVFTGDIGFDKYMEGKWDDENLICPEILDFLHSADHVVINVEGPVADVTQSSAQGGAMSLKHTMNPNAVKVFKNMHADIWNICNNHIMDAGESGMQSTLEYANKNNALTIGAGMNIQQARKHIVINEAGGIGLFGVGYQRACRVADVDKAGCYSWSDLEKIQSTINQIKSSCRWCVVVAHAGEEFTPLPSPYTRERYLKYLDMGADIVVAHHPHVPMNYEQVGKKIIFYSLGNFIFDTDYQRSQPNTESGVVVKLSFTENDFSFDAMGLEIDRNEEKIVKAELPRIFTDVGEADYKLLAPLSAKVLVEATKRQQTFLNPKEFKNATEEKWQEHFMHPMRTGRVPGETLDFHIICPLAKKADEGKWKQSKLEKVKEYMLEHIEKK